MKSVPRYLKFSRDLEKLTSHALQHMLEDPTIYTEWNLLIKQLCLMVRHTPEPHREVLTKAPSMTAVLTMLSFLSPELEHMCDVYARGMQCLMALIAEKAPDLVL